LSKRRWKIKKGTAERRIGLFGGTFNPIHLGHLRGAEEIREAFGLQEVIFIPAALPPHKMTEEMIQARHRLEMVKRATRKNSQFSASDVELKRPGKSYSVDTIRYFREKFEDSLYFILEEMPSWKFKLGRIFKTSSPCAISSSWYNLA